MRGSAFLLSLLAARSAAASSPIPREHARNLTVYHLNEASAGAIPADMDTGDAEGDLNFYLDEFLLPIECKDPNADFWAKFDCTNPERKGNLVVTKVELEVDERFTNYSECNFCDTGVDPISQRPCEKGKYTCDCGEHGETCDPSRAGVEHRVPHIIPPECTHALESKCGAVKGNADQCNLCVLEHTMGLRKVCNGRYGSSALFEFCPIRDSCLAALQSNCGSVQKNASACYECRHAHARELEAAHCGEFDAYRWCPSEECSDVPGDEWKCWHENIAQKAGGYWYSTTKSSQCSPTSASGSCGWRVLTTSTVHEECLRDSVASAVEADDRAGCFKACGQRNMTSPCWIGCFFDTLLGPAARHNSSAGAVTGMPLTDLIAGWKKPFLAESAGGCPKIPDVIEAKSQSGLPSGDVFV